jgi:2,3-bisphosphoglycerate-dependent phosphoglycerate mutase
MNQLILMRHGQSSWNMHHRFTGWVDVPLTAKGISEAQEASLVLNKYSIDRVFVSTLIRSQMSALIALSNQSEKIPVIQHEAQPQKDWSECYDEEAKKNIIPVHTAWELNERYYGRLQGLNKQETINRYGHDLVQTWRRSYQGAPPAGESLEDTAKRTIPFFQTVIEPFLQQNQTIFICAHGNSLRALTMHLEGISELQIIELEIETGRPIIYNYQDGIYNKIV